MKYKFKPSSGLEYFGLKVYSALVDNFSDTYFVGGTVRDLLLHKQVKDIDLATSARPEEIIEALKKYYIGFNAGFQNMGVIIATDNKHSATLASFRKDLKSQSRYPKILFVKSPKEDAKRRDFTINALYLSLKTGKILDFYNGIKDLKNKKIKFINTAEKKITQDPLRMIRGLRLCLQLKFKLEKNAKAAIKKHILLIRQLTKNKIETEILKLSKIADRKKIILALDNKKNLDKYF